MKRFIISVELCFVISLCFGFSNLNKQIDDNLSIGVNYYNEKQYDKAFPIINNLAQKGNSNAKLILAKMYYSGQGVKEDKVLANKLYKNAADLGQMEAQYIIGLYYSLGAEGYPKDESKAILWLTKAAEQGKPEAQGMVATDYFHGNGVEQNINTAIFWFQKASTSGDIISQRTLADIYFYGDFVPRDYKLALELYYKAANLGDDYSQLMIGNIYNKGLGVDKDKSFAATWFQKSANKNNAEAQYCLATLYLSGSGVEKDISIGEKLLIESANHNFDKAQLKLGLLYYLGQGVDQDKYKAAFWVDKARNNGNEEASDWWNKLELWNYKEK